MCEFEGSPAGEVIKAAGERKMGVLTLKAMAQTKWPEGAEVIYPTCWYRPISDEAEADLALRWTLSQLVTAALPPGDESLFRMALRLAMDYKPLSEAEVAELKRRAERLEPIFVSRHEG